MTVNALPSTEALRPPRGGDRPANPIKSASFSSIFEVARQVAPPTPQEQARRAEPPRSDPGRQTYVPRQPESPPQHGAPAPEAPRAQAPAAPERPRSPDSNPPREATPAAPESSTKSTGVTPDTLPSRLKPTVQAARRPDPNAPPPEGTPSGLPPWLSEIPIDSAPIAELPALPELPEAAADLDPQAQAVLPEPTPPALLHIAPIGTAPAMPEQLPAPPTSEIDPVTNSSSAASAVLQASPQAVAAAKADAVGKTVLAPSPAGAMPTTPEGGGRSAAPTPLPGSPPAVINEAMPEQIEAVAESAGRFMPSGLVLPKDTPQGSAPSQAEVLARIITPAAAETAKRVAVGQAPVPATQTPAAEAGVVAAAVLGAEAAPLSKDEIRSAPAPFSEAQDDTSLVSVLAPAKPESPPPAAGLPLSGNTVKAASPGQELLLSRDVLPQPLPGASAATPGAGSAASAPASPSASLTSTLGQPAFADELGAQVALWTRQGVQQAELRLNPVELGPVQVRIQLDGQQAQVMFAAEQQTTRDALQSALGQLAKALEQDGLRLAGSDVQAQLQQGSQQERRSSDGQATAESRAGGARDSRLRGLEASGLAPTLQPQAQRGLLDLYA
jgi:flagellar hook-length control protein FliK